METRGERESITVGSPGADSSTASLSLWSLRSDPSLCMTGPDVEEYCKQVSGRLRSGTLWSPLSIYSVCCVVCIC